MRDGERAEKVEGVGLRSLRRKLIFFREFRLIGD